MVKWANGIVWTIDELLERYWGYPSFRPYQREIIVSACEGRDTLALLATGGGKSIIYQVAGLARGGLTLVVSPLIALMEDQVQQLKRRGIRATAVHSGMSDSAIEMHLDNCLYGPISFLYVSPERLATTAFRTRVQAMGIQLLAVDEAHCISQWGYDFRPAYRQIAEIREELPEVPVLAVTATATPEVVEDICAQLAFRDGQLFNAGFARPNLSYGVRYSDSKQAFLLEAIRRSKGCGIVYARTRAQTEQIRDLLLREGITASAYHAGLAHQERQACQAEWMRGEKRIMVATNAFGMGIDKSDTRFVIHFGFPSSMEEYYQEAGRAGRDGEFAYALIIYDAADVRNARGKVEERYPDLRLVQTVYRELMAYFGIGTGEGGDRSYDFSLEHFASRHKYTPHQCLGVIGFMARMGILTLSEPHEFPLRLRVVADAEVLQMYRSCNQRYDRLFQYLLGEYPNITHALVPVSFTHAMRALRLLQESLRALLRSAEGDGLLEVQLLVEPRVLTFCEPRNERGALPLDMDLWRKTSTSERQRLEDIVTYVESSGQCRDVMLRGYFGEQGVTPCGRCDACRGQSGKTPTWKEQKSLRMAIFAEIEASPITVRELLTRHHDSREEAEAMLQSLLQRGEVIQGADGMLYAGELLR